MTNYNSETTYGNFHLYKTREQAFNDVLNNLDTFIDKGVHSIVETGTGKTGEGANLFCNFLTEKVNNTEFISYELS